MVGPQPPYVPSDHHLAKLSSAAYFSWDVMRQFAKSDYVKEFVADNDVAYLIGYGDTCVIAVRGSDEKQDWFRERGNLNAKRRPLHDLGTVHSGFALSADKLLSDLQVWDATDRFKRVYLTGHSRGGAIATIMAARMSLWGKKAQVRGLVTFGSPRVGDRRFRDAFKLLMDGISRRYVYQSDPVTLLPSSFRGSRHVAKLYWWTGTKLRHRTKWLRWLWVSLTARNKLLGDVPSDHYVSNYIRMTAILESQKADE